MWTIQSDSCSHCLNCVFNVIHDPVPYLVKICVPVDDITDHVMWWYSEERGVGGLGSAVKTVCACIYQVLWCDYSACLWGVHACTWPFGDIKITYLDRLSFIVYYSLMFVVWCIALSYPYPVFTILSLTVSISVSFSLSLSLVSLSLSLSVSLSLSLSCLSHFPSPFLSLFLSFLRSIIKRDVSLKEVNRLMVPAAPLEGQ